MADFSIWGCFVIANYGRKMRFLFFRGLIEGGIHLFLGSSVIKLGFFHMGFVVLFATKDWVFFFLGGIWRELGFDQIELKELRFLF